MQPPFLFQFMRWKKKCVIASEVRLSHLCVIASLRGNLIELNQFNNKKILFNQDRVFSLPGMYYNAKPEKQEKNFDG